MTSEEQLCIISITKKPDIKPFKHGILGLLSHTAKILTTILHRIIYKKMIVIWKITNMTSKEISEQEK